MKKLLLSILVSSSVVASAQLAEGTIAPNFTATDLNGTSWTLYDILNSNKTVFMDVSATWCAPCWSFHNSHLLKDLYTQYGPTGTNEAVVLFVEGDPLTTSVDLNGMIGTTTPTKGNWVAGTPYPILDNASIADLYQISSFPTLFAICPDKKVHELPVGISVAAMSEYICNSSTGINAATLAYKGGIAGCAPYTVPIKATIANRGTTPLTSCVIKAYNGATEIASLNWTGNLATYQEAEVDLGTYVANANFEIKVKAITTGDVKATDDAATDNVYASNFVSPTKYQNLEIKLDNYAAEVGWAIFEPSNLNAPVYEKVYTEADNGLLKNESLNMLNSNTCYLFVIQDTEGDGICCQYGNGYYKLKDANGAVWLNAANADATYGQKIHPFKTGAALDIVENNNLNLLEVYPNPANEIVSINLDLNKISETVITIQNALGQIVKTINKGSLPVGSQTITIPTTELANGLYTLSVITNNVATTKKLTILK